MLSYCFILFVGACSLVFGFSVINVIKTYINSSWQGKKRPLLV